MFDAGIKALDLVGPISDEAVANPGQFAAVVSYTLSSLNPEQATYVPLTTDTLPKGSIYQWFAEVDMAVNSEVAVVAHFCVMAMAVDGFTADTFVTFGSVLVPASGTTTARIRYRIDQHTNLAQLTHRIYVAYQAVSGAADTARQTYDTTLYFSPVKLVGHLDPAKEISYNKISYQAEGSNAYAYVPSGTATFADFFGRIRVDPNSDCPNTSLQAVFKSRLGSFEFPLSQAILMLYIFDLTSSNPGKINQLYIGYGITGGLLSLKRPSNWLSYLGPFYGMDIGSVRAVIHLLFKHFLMLDLYGSGSKKMLQILKILNGISQL
jgi:hypothetical protein